VPGLTKDLTGKLFGDEGYIGNKLAEQLLRRGLALMTRVRRNMKALPIALLDQALLNRRNIADTIVGHIKEFPSLRLPKHRSAFNAFTHIIAAIVAYQIDPLLLMPVSAFIPLPNPQLGLVKMEKASASIRLRPSRVPDVDVQGNA
jgi:hypothetical protein